MVTRVQILIKAFDIFKHLVTSQWKKIILFKYFNLVINIVTIFHYAKWLTRKVEKAILYVLSLKFS